MPIYETHCHLNHEQFDSDRDTVVERAHSADVRRLLVVGFDTSSSRLAVSVTADHDQMLAAVGIHPEAAAEWSDATRHALLQLHHLNLAKVRAWGEIGLDYHWKTVDPALQKQVFAEQLHIATELRLPIIVHCRDAYDDTLDVLEADGGGFGVLHCFTGTIEQALRGISLGYHIGVGGVVTYKNSHSVREMVSALPLDRILLETDSPYLAPQTWRGKRNEPAYLTAVVDKLSEVLQLGQEHIKDATWNNAVKLFG